MRLEGILDKVKIQWESRDDVFVLGYDEDSGCKDWAVEELLEFVVKG